MKQWNGRKEHPRKDVKWTKEIALEWREMMKVHKNYKKVAEECLAKDPVKYAGLTGLTVSRKLEEYEV